MGQPIIFTAIKGYGDNRQLEKDANGYYRVTLGALNAFNASGDFYLAEGIKEFIENESHSLARRIKAGYLKGEAGHPVYETGMSKAEFFSRNQRIHQPLVSHHIREIILTPTDKPSGIPGISNLVLIEAWLKPSGTYGDALQKDLENPDCNVAFSIRSFTNDSVIGGTNIKKIVQIITWDWVVEPGIQLANKFSKLGTESICLEAIEYGSIDIEELSVNGRINECINCSFESNDEKIQTEELIRSISQLPSQKTNILKRW
jgi:hypothetical protein